MENQNKDSEQNFPKQPSAQGSFTPYMKNFSSFIYKKTEKVSSALYLVSNLLSEEEPLRWDLREAGMSLLNHSMSLIPPSHDSEKDVLETIQVFIIHILSKLQVCFIAGLISEMNFIVFKKELEHILQSIRERLETHHRGHYLLAEDFFRITDPAFPHLPEPSLPREEYSKGQNNVKDNVLYTKKKVLDTKDVSKRQSSISPSKHSNRQEMIIQYLKRVKEASIKDFSTFIKNCSEKTVQRELLQMVETGVLKKVGERRWSKYSLS